MPKKFGKITQVSEVTGTQELWPSKQWFVEKGLHIPDFDVSVKLIKNGIQGTPEVQVDISWLDGKYTTYYEST